MIIVIILVSLLIRFIPLDFPSFTADETRIAAGGYAIATTGKDELGRSFPILFNSLTDYHLPAVSYLTSLGIVVFGKSDFGARIPFILVGVGLVLLVYKISQLFSPKKQFQIICAAITAFSPGLIFLSKVPNDSILLTLSFTLLFYLLTRSKVNLIFALGVVLLGLLTSKIAWFITAPFVLLTLIFYQKNLSKRFKLSVSVLCLVLSLIALAIFLKIPQSQRSLSENNYPIFSDIGIKNGIEKLRGQGLDRGWPNSLERLLFNKSHYLTVGFFHFLSHLQPVFYFGQFDSKGEYGFMSMGAWSKAMIVPFFLGLIFIIQKGTNKDRLLIFYPLLLTFPAFFIYPNYNQSIIVLALPFIAIISVVGLINLNRLFKIMVISLVILEVLLNLIYLDPEIKNAQRFRPGWIKPIVTDGYILSQKNRVAFSDDLTLDIVPFLEWYTQLDPKQSFFEVPSPYKFHQTQIGNNIKIIGSDDGFRNCGKDFPTYIFASKRDLEEIQRTEEVNIDKIYMDSLDREVAYLLAPIICVK